MSVAVSRLERAESDDEKTTLMSLVAFLFKEHAVPDALRVRALEVVRKELNRRPLQETAVTRFAIRYLRLYGRVSDLDALAPYIIYRKSYISWAVGAWEDILKREGRTSPPVPTPLPEGTAVPEEVNTPTQPLPREAETRNVVPAPPPSTLQLAESDLKATPTPAPQTSQRSIFVNAAGFVALGLVLAWLAKRFRVLRS